jgi:hypothetical protein
MGVEHLKDKRTGLPRGAKSAPAALRAARWASRHLRKPDAVPPSELAGALLGLGCQEPDRFALLLDSLEARVQGRKGSPPEPPRRLKRLTVPGESQIEWLTCQDEPDWLRSLPNGFAIEGCWVDMWGKQFTFTIRSRTFPPSRPASPFP